MMWTASSIDKFDRLKAEIEERKKNTEREIEELKKNTQREIEELKKTTQRKIEELRKDVEWENEELHLLEELKINSEKALQLFESSVDDFEKKRTLKAKNKNKKLKLTNPPPIPSSIKAKGTFLFFSWVVSKCFIPIFFFLFILCKTYLDMYCSR